MENGMRPARRRILEAANRLFYREGIRAVSVDAIADAAGVTKKTLYYHFRSKDDLIAGYLAARDQPTLDQYKSWYDQGGGGIEDGIGALFDGIAASTSHPKWRGCGFMRTVGNWRTCRGTRLWLPGPPIKSRWRPGWRESVGWQG